jgi:hypothetical protein
LTAGQAKRSPANPPLRGKSAGSSARRHWTEVDHLDAVFLGEVDEHVADSAEAAVPRLDGGEREAGGDGGVDRVASRGEPFGADFGGEAMLGGDDAAPRARRRLAYVPILRPVIEAGIHL